MPGVSPPSVALSARRLQWAGQLVRMNDDRLAKLAAFGESKSSLPIRRRRGRPRKNWKEVVDADAPAGWTRLACDRPNCRSIVKTYAHAAVDIVGAKCFFLFVNFFVYLNYIHSQLYATITHIYSH
jgi:hypothetical protein